MKRIIIVVGLLILGIIILLFFRGQTVLAPESEAGVPKGTPTNSAPSFAREACLNKLVGDKCTMLTGKEAVTGICFASGSELACGPMEPDFGE